MQCKADEGKRDEGDIDDDNDDDDDNVAMTGTMTAAITATAHIL